MKVTLPTRKPVLNEPVKLAVPSTGLSGRSAETLNNTDRAEKMLEIVNRQRKIGIPAEELSEFAERAAFLIPAAAGKRLTVAFVSDHHMRRLNRSFRGKSATTDVLSFPIVYEEFEMAAVSGPDNGNLGDIVISAAQAQRQAAENGLDLETEIAQLILHGILHLCGYDHEVDDGEMDALELRLRDKLSIS